MEIKDRYVIFPDLHFPYHDTKAFNCSLKVLEYVNPTGFLLLGDTVEGESVSHWKWAKKKRPPLEYQLPEINQEVEEVNKYWDELDEVLDKTQCKKKVFTQGNHEVWFDNFVYENPFLSQYKTQNIFKLKERGYEYHKYGKYIKVGGSKLYAYHGGHYTGIHHARSHVLNLGCSIVYGHTHDCQRAVVTHISGAHMAHSLGCLSKMEKGFLKNRLTNWSHNVAVLDIFNNRNYSLQVLNIQNGVTSYNGNIMEG